jgi:hypothetical protein
MPTWTLDNAVLLQQESPYTFYRPSDEIIGRLEPGKATVKLIFRFDNNKPEEPAAERMWVMLDAINEDGSYIGILDNDPFYIKDLVAGDRIIFRKENIIQYDTLDDLNVTDVNGDNIEKFRAKSIVSNHILKDGYRVGRLYREEPSGEEDTGWTLMSDHETEEYVDDHHNLQYVAIGKVLNTDDSFLHLLDAPVDSEFIRDEITGQFFAVEDE